MKHDGERPEILIVDDDPRVLASLVDLFSESYRVLTASSGLEAIAAARSHADLCAIIMDIKMAGMDGVAAARAIRTSMPDVPQILHTAYPGEYPEGEIDEHERPFDYVQKGRGIPQLLRSVRNAVETRQLRLDNKALIRIAESQYKMYGVSAAMQDVFRQIHQVAPTDSKVMILGESGTGKGMAARAIHECSPRKTGPWSPLTCNSEAPATLVQSELFGSLKGSYTGADRDRVGLFEHANGGTVFLDEIGDLDINTQIKLLQVIDTGEFSKIGSPVIHHTNVRILCATHQNLDELVAAGRFRHDVLSRLNGVRIVMPPLRDHREDIPLLVRKHAEQYVEKHNLSPKVFDDEAMQVLIEHDWPRNVRQLLQTVEVLIVTSHSDIVFADDVGKRLQTETGGSAPRPRGLPTRLAEFERSLIISALVEAHSVTAAAKVLEIDRATLHKKIKSHGIDVEALRSTRPGR